MVMELVSLALMFAQKPFLDLVNCLRWLNVGLLLQPFPKHRFQHHVLHMVDQQQKQEQGYSNPLSFGVGDFFFYCGIFCGVCDDFSFIYYAYIKTNENGKIFYSSILFFK
jgi:hypothetical protein